MATQFTIHSRDNWESLQLSLDDHTHCVAALRAEDLVASAGASSALAGGFAEFFGELAANWRGWEGERRWSAPEGELSLRATSDRTGHTYLSVHLQCGLDEESLHWETTVNLVLEAGQLDRIAAEARAFMDVARGAV